MITNSCTKDESNKKDPIITWEDPADIIYGTLLSETQLNAMADVPGTFVYTPEIVTKLDLGANQTLKAEFTPTDITTYNSVSKTTHINVTASIKVTDIDGNEYNTIVIGTQTWMLENLRVTHYTDGEPILKITDDNEWGNLSSGAYCWQSNNESNKVDYGALYNWFAINSGKLCPAGWHIPTEAEWNTLITYLGGTSLAGGKMKETGTKHWSASMSATTNESGFTAVPGGFRSSSGGFSDVGLYCDFWSSTKHNELSAKDLLISLFNSVEIGYDSKNTGFSVRCLKD